MTTGIIVLIDFIVFYLTFMYQRATLLIARNRTNDAPASDISRVQAEYTPTWIGIVSWLNWITLLVALYLLWQVAWWCPVAYLIFRLFIAGLLPTFENIIAPKILNKYKER